MAHSPNDVQSLSVDEELSSLATELQVSRFSYAQEEHVSDVVPNSLVNIADNISAGTARLALYTEKHDEEDLLAAYDIAQSVPMEAFSLSTARALALEPFLKILHSALCVHADNNLRSLEFAANVSSLILALCPAEDDTKVEFLRARILQLEKLVRECEENPSIVLNLLMEAIVLRRCILKLATRDEERLNWRLCLASLLWDYWQRSGKRHLDILHEEMGLRRDILQAHGDNDSDRSSACRSLAGSIYALYMSTGDLTLLDEVIMLEREVMNLCSEGDSGRDVSCGNLASSLLTRFNQTGETALLDEALKLQREALRLRPQGHPYRADSCEDLASALWTYFNQTGDTALLEEALELERDVLRLTPEGHPDRARSCGNLASSLWTCFNQRGDTALLDEALMLEREALRLRPEGHPARALTCGNLAVSLRTHFDQTGDTALLDEALELEREALGLRPEGHPDRADSCGNLASSLWGRFNQTGDTVLLDEALMLEREALRLMPEGQLGHARLCGSLASSLWTRFNQTGDTVLLDEALKLEREVLRLTPEGHLDRASSCGNLASSLWTRYVQTGDMVLLDEALELQREVLRLTVEGHPNRALRCGNLASSLKARFHQTGDTALLDETLELEREALRLMPEGHPDRASLLGNLAFSLRTRFDQTGDAALLDEALSLCTHALKKPTVSSSTHVLLRAHLADIHAIASYSSYSPSAAIEHLREAVQHRAGLMARFYHVNDVLRLWVGAVLSDEDNVRLLAVYQAVIEVLPELGNVVLDKASRLHRWRAAGNLPLEAFHHALKANNLPLGMELLEQGRAVLWSQTLAMQDPELQGLTDDWKIQLQTLLQSISFSAENGNSLDSELSARDGAHASYTRLQQLLKEIRASPGLERFMCVPSYPELLQVVSLHPVVILAPENKACHAIIISSSPASTVHLILDIIAISDLENLGHDMRGLDLNVRAMSASAVATEVRAMGVSGRREDPAVRKLHQALKKLWVGIVKPILDRLGLKKASGRDRPRLHWCPMGTLGFLPIHAAGIYSGGNVESCADYVVSSYTPTLSALNRARSNLAPIFRGSLVLLAAGAHETARSLNMPFLDNVKAEITDVSRLARASNGIEVLEYGRTSAAKVHEVTEALPRANIVHLACHGVQDQEDPLSSGFCLGDGKLAVCQLMDIKLDHAFMAFLSACETAKGDKNQPDQTIHLAAAMLFCGFRSVVATMWSISDDDGPAVARAFYEVLLAEEDIDADAVAYALDAAVSKLRSEGASPSRWASFIHVGA